MPHDGSQHEYHKSTQSQIASFVPPRHQHIHTQHACKHLHALPPSIRSESLLMQQSEHARQCVALQTRLAPQTYTVFTTCTVQSAPRCIPWIPSSNLYMCHMVQLQQGHQLLPCKLQCCATGISGTACSIHRCST